jgi:hypothetical protein
MARQTFTAGQVLTAAQLTTLQASVWSDDINAQTGTSYTLVLTDAGKQVTLTNASAIALTVPANSTVAYATGVRITLINLGAGAVTVSGAGGVTVGHGSNDLTMPQYGVMVLFKTGTDTWAVEYSYDADDDQPVLASQIFG